MTELKLISIGDEIGIVLPRDLLTGLGVGKDDTLSVVATPNGLHITVGDTAFNGQMEIARRIMREKSGLLRQLADS